MSFWVTQSYQSRTQAIMNAKSSGNGYQTTLKNRTTAAETSAARSCCIQ